jgi:galactokinase
VALQRDVRFVFRPRADRQVRVHSVEFGESYTFDLDNLAYNDALLWTNYVMGVAWSLMQEDVCPSPASTQ